MRSEVGRVVAITRYPVKAMAGEALRETWLSWHGLSGDRRWAFVRPGQIRSGFPWLTLRELPALAQYQPSLPDPERPDTSPTWVRTPRGALLDVTDPALAAELGDGVGVMKNDRGLFDAFPLSLLTTGSLAALRALVGRDLDPRRFRPNLVVQADAAFVEETWVGSVLRVGGARIRVDARDHRCVVVGVDPQTTAADPGILRAIAQHREVRFGVYGSTVEPGRVAVGDAVLLEGA